MKKNKFVVVILSLVIFAGIQVVGAEEKFGVRVYDGAKYDEATSKFLKESMSLEAFCYVTKDNISKVIDFYKKQAGLKLISDTKESAMFKKGDVDITIQNPWMDMKTGKLVNDTLISIVKQKK